MSNSVESRLQYDDSEYVDVRNFSDRNTVEVSVYWGDSRDEGHGIFTDNIEQKMKGLYEEAVNSAEEEFDVNEEFLDMPETDEIREEDTMLFHLGTLRLETEELGQLDESPEYLEHLTDYILENQSETFGFIQN